jgi:hypothetical protein
MANFNEYTTRWSKYLATGLTHKFSGKTKRETGVDKWVEVYCSRQCGTEQNSYVVLDEVVIREIIRSYSGAEDSTEEIGQFMKR